MPGLSTKYKCLLVVLILVANSINAQLQLIEDSWSNAGNWFQRDSYQKSDLVFWGIGGTAVALAFVYDLEIQSALSFNDPELGEKWSPYMEPFGNPINGGTVALALYLGGEWAGNKELSSLSSTVLQSMLTAGLTVMGLKLIFHRVRPEEQTYFDPYQFRGPSFRNQNLSFPSGHSAMAFSIASSVSAYYEDPLYLAIPLYSLAALTAWQRVYDQKHWPSDIVMGGLIGVFVGRKIAKWQKEKDQRISLSPALLINGQLGIGMSLKLDPIKPEWQRPF